MFCPVDNKDTNLTQPDFIHLIQVYKILTLELGLWHSKESHCQDASIPGGSQTTSGLFQLPFTWEVTCPGPANGLGKIAEDGPCTHEGDPDGAPGSHLVALAWL